MNTIRCSSLDMLFACTPSVIGSDAEKPYLRISNSGEAAEEGKAIHELLACFVRTGGYDIKGVCAKRGIADDSTIAELIVPGVRAWQDVKQFFPTPAVERIVKSDTIEAGGQEYVIAGTVDVLSPIGTADAIFVDWKSGYVDEGYHNQMCGYAYAIWHRLGKPAKSTITGVVAFLRHRYHRVVKYTVEDLQAWEYDLTHNVLGRLDGYHTGRHCTKCSLYASCPARTAIVRGTVDTLLKPAGTVPDEYGAWLDKVHRLLAGLTPENKGLPEVGTVVNDLIFRCKLAQKAVDDCRALLKEAATRVGPIPLANDLHLVIRPTEVRVLDPARAFKVARQHLSDADILDATKISLPKLLAAKAAKYGRGEKTAARHQLEHDLEAAGAVNVTVQQRLEEVDLQEQGNDPGTKDVRIGAAAQQPVAELPARDREPRLA